MQEQSNFFQDSLRKLGAWLDAASARSVIMLQRSDGFAIRYYRQDIDTVFLQRFFTAEEVASLQRGNVRVRRRFVRQIHRQLHGVSAEPGGYQDIFRALGYLLDTESASSVRLLENEEHDTLVLHRAIPSEDRKAVDTFDSLQREVLRKQALARRTTETP